MPCKSRSEAELRGSKLPSLLFSWALLKNSIRLLNHRQKKKTHCLQCWCAFFSEHKVVFSQPERETFARFVLGRRSRRHKKRSILSRLRGEFRINVCSRAAATMEKVHASIKMSACECLRIRSLSNIFGGFFLMRAKMIWNRSLLWLHNRFAISIKRERNKEHTCRQRWNAHLPKYCTELEYFHLIVLYTSPSTLSKGQYWTFHSTTFVQQLDSPYKTCCWLNDATLYIKLPNSFKSGSNELQLEQ